MPSTIIEKIVARHTRQPVRPGSVVWLELDLVTARDFGGANVVKHLQTYFPDRPVADASKTLFTFDCQVPANTIGYADNQQTCRAFARRWGIRVYDVDAGIGSHVIIDEGHCVAGSTVVGTDSHLNLVGAIGALGLGMGDRDVAFAFRTRKVWFKVPETLRVEFTGSLEFPATAKDLALLFLSKLGPAGALGRVVEFSGAPVRSLDLDGRITLSSLVTEAGGVAGIVEPDESLLVELPAAASGRDATVFLPDEGAKYSETIRLDVSGLRPKVSLPGNPANVVDVAEVEGTKIDSVLIGSCTNGRYGDFAAAAKVLAGRKVKPGVMLKVAPSTRSIYGRLLRDGILASLYESGAIIVNQGCAGCAAGQVGMTGRKEVQISTGNRNFYGKQGLGETYLASPVVAAYSAIFGEIRSPE